jgi:hypothetical protein
MPSKSKKSKKELAEADAKVLKAIEVRLSLLIEKYSQIFLADPTLTGVHASFIIIDGPKYLAFTKGDRELVARVCIMAGNQEMQALERAEALVKQLKVN